MRTLVFVLVLAVTSVLTAIPRALAGPPPESHFSWAGFAPTKTGLWLVGVDDCDEGGRLPIAVRLDGKGEVERDRDRVAALGTAIVPAARWSAGDDVYEAGERTRASHDRGKTWAKIAGVAELLTAVIGASDRVYGLAWNRLVITTDRGKTWQVVYAVADSRRCY